MLNTIEPNIILGTVVVFGVLLLLLIGLLVTYLYGLQKSLNAKKGSQGEDKVSPDKLSLEVHNKSLKILEDAHKRARDILSNAENFMSRDESRITQEIEKIAQVYIEKYETSLGTIKLEAIKTMHNIPKDINKSFSDALLTFQDELKSEVEKAEEKFSSLSLERLKKSESEIEKHKASRMRKIDEEAVTVVTEIAKKVLARDISDPEHEKLVMKALEDAKKEGLFNA